jgi:hypothetical protein
MKIKEIKIKYILFLVFILLTVYGLWRNIVLSNNARYTIGVTEEIFLTVSEGMQIKYSYIINGRTYNKEEDYSNLSIKNMQRQRYFVEYNYKNPDHSRLLQEKPVPDKIRSAPPNGWKKIPGE